MIYLLVLHMGERRSSTRPRRVTSLKYKTYSLPGLYLASGGGRAANFGGRVTIFLTQIWGGVLFFKLDLGEGYEFLSLYIFTKSQYKVQETLS